MNVFRKAQRKRAKIRLGIGGPSGSGKTYSSLLIASGLGEKVAVIDTEHGSAELYADLFDYDVAVLKPPFSPERYISLIKAAEDAGYEVIVIDSLSHAWRGEGGMLEIHDAVTSVTGNSFAAWREVSPIHNALVEKMLQSPAHIIATLRAKQDYVIVDENGKKMVRKVGLAPVFREGIEYEFTMYFEMTADHLAVVSKDRTGLFGSKPPFTPTKETGLLIRNYLETGVDSTDTSTVDETIYQALLQEAESQRTKEELFQWFNQHKAEIESLPVEFKEKFMENLKKLKNKFTVRTASPSVVKLETKEARL